MSTHILYEEKEQIYFCTITCFKWLSLFELTNSYDLVYKWFSYLEEKDMCKVSGYVIMPNHLHVLIYYNSHIRSINKIIGEGKRFMAYGIVKRLKEKDCEGILKKLIDGVTPKAKDRGKKHNVFKHHSDIKLCYSKSIVEQKLDYIHHNPVQKKWNLVEDYVDYIHSSAAYYELDFQRQFNVTHYMEV